MRDLPPFKVFNISVTHNRKSYKLQVEVQRLSGNRLETLQFASGGKVFTLESDRPFWRHRNLWKRNYTMKLIQGHTYNVSLLERVIEVIKDAIRSYERFDPDYENPKNAKGKETDWDEFEKL